MTDTNWAEEAPRRHLLGAQVIPAAIADGEMMKSYPMIVLGFAGLDGEEPVCVQLVATTKQFRKFVQALGEGVTIANSMAQDAERELLKRSES